MKENWQHVCFVYLHDKSSFYLKVSIIFVWIYNYFIICDTFNSQITFCKSSRPEAFLRQDILKICRKFTGEHTCRSVISKNLFCSLIEITLRHGCSPINLLYIFRTPFLKHTSIWLLLFLSLADGGCYHAQRVLLPEKLWMFDTAVR